MANSPSLIFWFTALSIIILFTIAIYTIVFEKNLIRILISVELLTKGVTLLLVVAGYLTGKAALTQTLIITMIVVEVVVIAVAASVIIGQYKVTNSIDVSTLRDLKG